MRKGMIFDWRPVLFYGLCLAAGAFALQWLDTKYLARAYSGEVYVFLIAAGFLALGVFVGVRLFGSTRTVPVFDGNPAAKAALGITERETEVLLEIAAGHSGKEIAHQAAAGASEEQLQRLTSEMDEFRRNYANPLYRLPMTFAEMFPVGVLVSLICAGLLRNRRFLPAR